MAPGLILATPRWSLDFAKIGNLRLLVISSPREPLLTIFKLRPRVNIYYNPRSFDFTKTKNIVKSVQNLLSKDKRSRS